MVVYPVCLMFVKTTTGNQHEYSDLTVKTSALIHPVFFISSEARSIPVRKGTGTRL
jgi:hypothetical protein